MAVRRTAARTDSVKRPITGALPRVPQGAFRGPKTLEDRLIPGVLLFAFVGLVAIQLFHLLTH